MAKINKIPDFLAMAKEVEKSIVDFAKEEGVKFFVVNCFQILIFA